MERPEAYWLNALNLTLGTHRVRKLLMHSGSPERVWHLTASELSSQGINEKALESIETRKKHVDPEKEWERLQEHEIVTLTQNDEHYPKILKTIHSTPLMLYVRGDVQTLNSPSLAVVGTRRHSSYGKMVTESLIRDLVRAGLSIVSGLAQGIDALAHSETLKARGTAIAVLGNGLDSVVPTSNQKLARSIIETGGAIVSEYPWGTPPLKQHFPARNRIIAGLSLGTLVIESHLPGGSLITAEHAMEEGREVFAVPGPITGAASEGTNKLIQDGAHPITSPHDILDILSLTTHTPIQQPLNIELSATEERIVSALETEPLYIDEIIKQTNLKAAEANARLTALELKGVVKNIGGNTYQRIK